MKTSPWPVYNTISGTVIMIGFGSIGRGTLPLIERHLDFDRSRLVVIDPHQAYGEHLRSKGARFIAQAITPDNYQVMLVPLLEERPGQALVINLSVDTDSLDLMRLSRAHGALYIDAATEPWPGFYDDVQLGSAARTVDALRQAVRVERRDNPGGTTAVSCCGANPGMVSWLLKQALVDLAEELELDIPEPSTDDRRGWASLLQRAGVTGIHIAERDTQRARQPRPLGAFWNTWSVPGFIAEGLQPAELGWGTHERWQPDNAFRPQKGSGATMFLEQPGGATRVRTWCPTQGAQHGLLIPHNESVSIADFFTLRDSQGAVEYRPTCHYAYHPSDAALLSLDELFGGGQEQPVQHVLGEGEILDGMDELGVLLYGHARNAYWYGSQLTIEQARQLAPDQNATGLQVCSALLAGIVWALENPDSGIVEADEMDYRRCLEIQAPYLGAVKGYYTSWTPLEGRGVLFEEDLDTQDPWQFRNVLVHI